jgi:hypothetical protein
MLQDTPVGVHQGCGAPVVTPVSARGRLTTESRAVEGAQRFTDELGAIDLRARQSGRTVPTSEEIQITTKEFWRLLDTLGACSTDSDTGRQTVRHVREILSPAFLRSRLWLRALVKPHGVAGDFRMLEWIHDLQGNPCLDPTQPVVVNLLDSLFAEVQRVSGVWHRRSWFRDVVLSTNVQLERPVRFLDVASGGSRSARDALDTRPGCLRLAAIDEDPAAIAFVRSSLATEARDPAGLHCAPVEQLPEVFPKPAWPEGGFDLVASSRLGDALEDSVVAELVGHMVDLTRPGGTTAICSSSLTDRSRVAMEWISDWRTVRRSEDRTRDLFPAETRDSVQVTTSPDGAVVYARARKR